MVEDEMVEGRGMCWKMREEYWGRREREEDEGRVLREEGNDKKLWKSVEGRGKLQNYRR
jgi:hypothetical protein